MTDTAIVTTSSIIESARAIMSIIQPLSGTRGTGTVKVTATGDDVSLVRNWALIPIVNGAARPDLTFKVGQGPNRAVFKEGRRVRSGTPEPPSESWWTITDDGVDVDVVSILGGARHNLPAGTQFVLDPAPEGLNPICLLNAAVTTGADPTHFGGCKSVVMYEQLQATGGIDAFRSGVGRLPAVVILWDGSEPADGTTQSSINRGQTRVGTRAQLFKERFNVFVLSERSDSDHMRAFEGVKLLEDVTSMLTDRQSVDGEVFSTPTGIQVRGRNRVLGDRAVYQNTYIYLLQLSITAALKAYDFRTYNPWLLTRSVLETVDVDSEGDRKVVVDQSFAMV